MVVLDTDLPPAALLPKLKRIERVFGRPQGGQRWSARVLDLDIVLWSGGIHVECDLAIPHRSFRERRFVRREDAERIAARDDEALEGCKGVAAGRAPSIDLTPFSPARF